MLLQFIKIGYWKGGRVGGERREKGRQFDNGNCKN